MATDDKAPDNMSWGMKCLLYALGILIFTVIILAFWFLIRAKMPNAKAKIKEPAVELVWGPGAENSVGPHINNNTIHFASEIVIRESKGAHIGFPLARPFLLKTLTVNYTYTALNKRPCGNAAFLASLASDNNHLAILSDRIDTEQPQGAKSQYYEFGEGIQLDNLYLALYDDMCHPTDLRVTFVGYGQPLNEPERVYSTVRTYGKRFNIFIFN